MIKCCFAYDRVVPVQLPRLVDSRCACIWTKTPVLLFPLILMMPNTRCSKEYFTQSIYYNLFNLFDCVQTPAANQKRKQRRKTLALPFESGHVWVPSLVIFIFGHLYNTIPGDHNVVGDFSGNFLRCSCHFCRLWFIFCLFGGYNLMATNSRVLLLFIPKQTRDINTSHPVN